MQGFATNLIVAGNTIVGGTPADAQGAGIYTGCTFGSGSDLTLTDSTVTGNTTVAGGVAGIDGEVIDHLTLANAVNTGNIGGSDLGGFNGSGSITASFSDACLAGAALAGSGNICAPPLLASVTDVLRPRPVRPSTRAQTHSCPRGWPPMPSVQPNRPSLAARRAIADYQQQSGPCGHERLADALLGANQFPELAHLIGVREHVVDRQ